MLIIGEESWAKHRPWARWTLGVWIVGFGAYWLIPSYLTGGSWFGIICGFAATFIFVFEWSYALRRRSSWNRNRVIRFIRWCCGWPRAYLDQRPTRDRLRHHIWLGLISVPLVYLHSGRRWGGTIPTVFFVVFMATIVSGLIGLFMQQWLPRLLKLEIPNEMIFSEIHETLLRLRWESELLVAATCGPVTLAPHSKPGRSSRNKDGDPSRIDTLKVHRSGLGAHLLDHVPEARIDGTGALLEFHQKLLDPFLAEPSSSSFHVWVWRLAVGFFKPVRQPNVLWTRGKAQAEFWKLRNDVVPAAHEVVEALERACDLRRQLESQAQLHALLQYWLVIHLPIAIVLLCFWLFHVITAIKYQQSGKGLEAREFLT